jgi:mycothiol system anti-sigma-R factor
LSCLRERGLVQSYVDGELNELQSSEIRQHLDRCEECWSAYICEITLRSSFRDTSLYEHAPEDLEKRIRLSLQKEDRGDVPLATPSDDETSA